MNKSHTTILHQQFTVFPGIEYVKEVFEDHQDGRQRAYILRISRSADVRVDTVMAPDGQFRLQEPSVSAKACRRENETLIGVINADFFDMTNGIPRGVVVIDGTILKEAMPDNTRFFGICHDGTPVIGGKTDFHSLKHSLRMAVGGRDLLVDGENLPDPVLEPVQNRHPRTAVCICENNDLLLVVLEGRNPGVSEGLYLKRFGMYLQSLGAKKALNLDGGGSTVMALRMLGQQDVEVVNTPSDGMERVCGNGIALFARHKGDGICRSAYVTPQQEYVAPGTRLTMSAYGLDSLLGACDLPKDIRFSVPEDSGCSVLPDGTLITPQTDCDVTVSVSAEEQLLGTALLHVRTPDALHLPASFICAENEVHEPRISATLKGRSVLSNRTSYLFHPLEDIGRFDEDGFFHAGGKACEGDVLVCSGNNGPRAVLHVQVGRLPQQLAIAPEAMKTEGCAVRCDRPFYFSPRSGEQVLQVETLQAESMLQFDAPIHKKPKAVGMWVHGTEGELPAFALTVQSGSKTLQATAFERAEPSDSVWTYMEAPIRGDIAQTPALKITLVITGIRGAQFAVDSFRLVYDYVVDDTQLPEVKRISMKKYAPSGENERIKITAYFSVGNLLPCYAPLDYKRLRILIDENEYTGNPGHYGVNKGAASLMLHNVFVSKGLHRLRVCAQTHGGNQSWADVVFDTEQLEAIP